jgi:hypothetical protein
VILPTHQSLKVELSVQTGCRNAEEISAHEEITTQKKVLSELGTRLFKNFIKPLKPSGKYLCHLLQYALTLHFAHIVYLCIWVPYDSQSKQRLFT